MFIIVVIIDVDVPSQHVDRRNDKKGKGINYKIIVEKTTTNWKLSRRRENRAAALHWIAVHLLNKHLKIRLYKNQLAYFVVGI